MSEVIAVSELDAPGARRNIDMLADILHDCVDGGASVSFMWPFDKSHSHSFWDGVVVALTEKRLRLFVASVDSRIWGTVQLWLDGPCNQRHRGDIRKLLVHRTFRRLGLARALMRHVETEAVENGLSLLTLDTATGGAAEQLYDALGWQRCGIIPRYAKWPDGRFCDTTIFYKAIA
ncbi:MAG: GNAT family N-acetyltransferase [Rhizomicrobium sp.]|jgi:ribosomal protein S18 acetylase RimI-like enzyme